jgi:hypothetical protein
MKKGSAEDMFTLIAQEEKATTQTEVDIIRLKKIILSIKPYSRWWRWGYVGSLRRAIKALERQKKEENKNDGTS